MWGNMTIRFAFAVSVRAVGYFGHLPRLEEFSARPDLTRQQSYVLHRISSADPTGGNADKRTVEPGGAITVMDVDGPGAISHIWFTIADNEAYHLKRIVLRIYWDGEATPSVEAPIGDFFGLGLGAYHPGIRRCCRWAASRR